MHPVEIKKNIYWVGAIDWAIRDFHGYSTYQGTTYNAFLVMGEKITLFDAVKRDFSDELLKSIAEIVDPSKIDYLVVNHAEMDHSGALPAVMEAVKPEKLYCSAACRKALIDHFHEEGWPYEVVKTGQEVGIGGRTVQFLETRMLHWPDSMFSYLKEDRLLISSDAFGHHWATSERFDDQVNETQLFHHCAKYYANILLLYSGLVQKLLAQVKELALPIDMIAPDHGIIWRTSPGRILEAYDRWSQQKSIAKALVIYDTMWKSTEAMAKAVADGIAVEGASVKLLGLKENHRSEIMTELLDAKAVVCGSPTLNNGMLPAMQDMLSYMKGLKPSGKIGALFGSYGWSGEAVAEMREYMDKMGIAVIEPMVKVRYVPRESDLKECYELGRKTGQALKSPVAAG
ncbi:MAG: flavodoxin domain-containing protein [Candidatus Eremiobacteraeota bacterium]|nr:flavodoxin domain-containing protein [Candidatus Eremiobacteraeota bacterium]